MTLRHMKIFRCVCENGYNTTKAADALHMTQPAVSLAIRELEAYYGVLLFDRLGRRLHITEGGRRLLQYACHICSMFDDMEKTMRDWDSLGLLRVGASITVGSQFLPGYVKSFYGLCPGTEVRVLVASSDDLEQKLLNSELDVALMEGIPHDRDLISEEYLQDRLTVVCPVNGCFRQGQQLTVEEFRNQKFLLREPGSGTREVFEQVIRSAGFSVIPSWEATSTTALINAVINGLGIAVLPQRMVEQALRQGQVLSVNVQGLDFCRSFRIVYHKDKYLTASAKAFMQLCRDYEREYPRSSFEKP